MVVLFVLGYFCTVYVVSTLANNMTVMDDFRLPSDILPQHYKLDVIVDLDDPEFEFNGTVLIKIICMKSTKTITLHCSELTILDDDVYVKEEQSLNDTNSLAIEEQVYIPGSQFYRIHLEKILNKNKAYYIYLPFKGNLSTGLVGFYRSSYLDRTSNSTKWIAATHFEPTYARKAFPCFDEPAMKARFTIRIGHKETLSSISNMPQLKRYYMTEKEDGWMWHEYQETVPMSTYLVAYVIGNLNYKQADIKPHNTTFFKVWARPGVLNQVDFAIEFAPEMLDFYKAFFNVKYSLPKLDLVAIPDFSIGAMENWGLVTFRETALLYSAKGSTIKDKYGIASVIAHEISHQWFGNLVTMKWWTDLWLKEGFATFLGNICVQHLFPDWDFLDEAIIKCVESVYYLDSLNSSHPVSVPINNPNEIAQIFDTISYQKGSIIIRMMSYFLGTSFQTGLSDYLNEHKFGNADQDDLWNALTLRAHKDGTLGRNMTVKTIMDSWTLQTGYPLVTVERDYDNGVIILTQEKFQRKPSKQGEQASKHHRWWIPITFTTLSENSFYDAVTKHWLNTDQDIIAPDIKADEWVIFNIDVAGLYRVQYDNKNWKMIIATLNSENYTIIPATNRANLLLDAFDLAWKGILDYELVFDMAKYLHREAEYLPLLIGLQQLDVIGRILIRTPLYGNYQTYVKNLLQPIYARFDNLLEKKNNDTRVHALITEWACAFNIPKCCNKAMTLFKQWQNSMIPNAVNPIPTDVRTAVYSTAIRDGDSDTWTFLWNRYRSTNIATEKRTILKALACSKDVWTLQRYLDWSIKDTSEIRRQDSPLIYAAMVSQPIGAYIATNFLRRKIGDIQQYHSQKSEVVSSYLTNSAKHFIYSYEIKQWKNFIEKNINTLKGSSLAAVQSIDIATAQGDWYDQYYSKMVKLLSP